VRGTVAGLADASDVAATNPKVANFVALASGRKLQVQGIEVGSTDLIIQVRNSPTPLYYSVSVHRDLSDLVRHVDQIVDGEPPRIYPLNGRIVVEGVVSDLETLEAIANVARVYDEDFANLMSVRGDHQVQLEVVFAEVSRTGLRQLGMNAFFASSGFGMNMSSPASVSSVSSTGLPLADAARTTDRYMPISTALSAAGSSAFNLATFVNAANVIATLAILDEHRISKVLAQPTLVALSGQQAEFLAGGQIPYPLVGANGQVTVQFQDYGVKLLFVPTVLASEVVDMRVQVEVSEPDYANATSLGGVPVPGVAVRKSQSHLRVDNGMTFAMAGLLTERTSYQRSQIPGLGQIPIIGTLFRYVRHTRDESELVIFVTPRLVRPLGPSDVPAAPGTTENNNPSDVEFFLLGMSAHSASRTAEPSGDVGLQR